MKFLWIYNLFLLPLPLILYKFLPRLKHKRKALIVPFYNQIDLIIKNNKNFNRIINKVLFWLSWLFLIGALIRPVQIGAPLSIDQEGRNIMLAIDISGSMATRDIITKDQYLTRLEAVKKTGSDFIKKRKGDKLGLILFGSKPYLLSPLTFDINTLEEFLVSSEVGLAGRETGIGDAIALAVKNLIKTKGKDKIIILLTDGRSNVGNLTPKQAVEIAKNNHIKIYTIGFGSNKKANFFGMEIALHSEFDEQTLKMIADETNGQYFKSVGLGELKEVYKKIDELERSKDKKITFHSKKELFYIPLFVSLMLLTFLILRTNRDE